MRHACAVRICQAETAVALVLFRALPAWRQVFGGSEMISRPREPNDYPDRVIDCQEAMEPGFQAIVDCMLEAGWSRGETLRSLKRLIAADNMTQKENARTETQLAIARAMMRAGKPL